MVRHEDKKVGRSGISALAELASEQFRQAERLERREPIDSTDALFKPIEARRAREDSERIFKAPKALVGDATTELVPAPQEGEQLQPCRHSMLDTLAEPNIISVDASEHRASLATRANVLSQALDAQVTAGAKNSLEKMLCHQLVTAHTVAMETIIRLQQFPTGQPPVEQARLINCAAQLMEVFQNGCVTLVKLRTGGTQRVEVRYQQQVNVGEGGQAVIGSVNRSRRGSRRGRVQTK